MMGMDCVNQQVRSDLISRQMLLEYIHGEPVGKLLCDKYNLDGLIEQFPSAQLSCNNLQQLATDCISRQAAIDAIKELCQHYTPTKSVNHPHMNFVIEELEHLPSAQPERENGSWIRWYETKKDDYGVEYIPHCKCSKCGTEYDPHSSISISFCNVCGSDMRGENDG